MIKRLKNFRSFSVAALLVLAVFVFILALKIFWIKTEADEKLAQAKAENASPNEIPFAKTVRSPINSKHIQIWQTTGNVRALARFNDSIFAATDGGLVRLSETGEMQKHFTVLDGLPESDLTSLAVFGSRLFIGTGSSGLLAFDGERFENYRWKDREAKSITALLNDNGRLLIGTFAGGLIEFDGGRFREIQPEKTRIKSVNHLSKQNEKLFVGTFDNGLWLSAAGSWRHFNAAAGLPSNRIVGVVEQDENVFVGTDLGIVSAKSNELSRAENQTAPKIFRSLATTPTLSSLTLVNNQIFWAKDNGEIFTFTESKSLAAKKFDWNKPDKLANARLLTEDENLWLFGNRGIWRMRDKNSFGISFAQFGKMTGETVSNNVVSALAVDGAGRVWAGTFRDGIDVLSGDGKPLAHLENENLREINFLLSENQTGKVIAATAGGAAIFDRSLRSENLTKTDGLPSNSITHVAVAGKAERQPGGDLFFATSRGLSFQTQNGWRALTSVHGLPSDNVFAAVFYKNTLYVGTLGGLAQIENGRIARAFKDSNSRLTNNWVSALCEADGRLFIGTYGGGVLELTASGELHAFKNEIGEFAVNPNAMYADDARLYIGTLDGVWILDLRSQKWLHLTDELPARTVLSITADAENIYFGTVNGIARFGKNYFSDEGNNVSEETF